MDGHSGSGVSLTCPGADREMKVKTSLSLSPGGLSGSCAVGSSEAPPREAGKQGSQARVCDTNGASAPGNAVGKRHLAWGGVGCGGGGGTSALHFIPLGKTENTKTKDTFASPAALSFLGGELFLVQGEDFSVFLFFFLVPWKFLVGEFASWRNSGICYRECQPQSHSDSEHVTFPHAASRWPSFLNLFFRGAKEL